MTPTDTAQQLRDSAMILEKWCGWTMCPRNLSRGWLPGVKHEDMLEVVAPNLFAPRTIKDPKTGKDIPNPDYSRESLHWLWIALRALLAFPAPDKFDENFHHPYDIAEQYLGNLRKLEALDLLKSAHIYAAAILAATKETGDE